MSIEPSGTEQKSIERLAFEFHLRTGRKLSPEALQTLAEAKFNPYHDPDNGQFTNAVSGRAYVRGSSASDSAELGGRTRFPLRVRRNVSGTLQQPRIPLRLPQRRNDGRPVPYLSPLHNQVRADAISHPPDSGTKEWSVTEFAKWKVAGGDIFAFKQQWVRGYRSAINAAARRFDLPPGLVAGVALTEVGGDPLAVDRLAYDYRNLAGSPKRDRTSFGDLSVQFRRAAEALGYSRQDGLTTSQREMLIASLQDTQINIFIAAKHLSDLRDIDFSGTAATNLSRSQIEVIASRYNRGSESTRQQIEQNLDYGRSVTKRWVLLNQLVR